MTMLFRPRILAALAVLLFANAAQAQGSSAILLLWGLYFALPVLVLALLIWAVVWLVRGRKAEATRSFLQQRENQPPSGRIGE